MTDYTVLRKRLALAYSALAGVLFLWLVPVCLNVSYASEMRHHLLPVFSSAMSGIVAMLFATRDSSKKLSVPFIVAAGTFLFILLRMLIDRWLFDGGLSETIVLRAYLAVFVFLPFGLVLDEDEARRGLHFMLWCWIAVNVFFSLLAWVSLLTNAIIYPFNAPAEYMIGVEDGRLWLLQYVTICGHDLFTAMTFAVFEIISCKRLFPKVILGISIAVMYVPMILTDTRAALFSVMLIAAAVVFIIITARDFKNTAVKVCAGLAAGFAAAALIFATTLFIPPMFSAFPNGEIYLDNVRRGDFTVEEKIVETAASDAPAAEDERLEKREIDATFTGRTYIWKLALTALKENREGAFIKGVTPIRTMTVLNSGYDHIHNIFLDCFMAWGIVGFLLMLTLVILFVISAFRLVFNFRLSVWQRFLPMPAGAIIFTELAESLTRLNSETYSLFFVFLFMGLSFGLDRELSKKSKDIQ